MWSEVWLMSGAALDVRGLGKAYRIGARQQGYRTLRETLVDTALVPFRGLPLFTRPNRQHGAAKEINWSLRDVSFRVLRGDVVGIIGRNGAGKSTLLKILSRITEPTEGYADIHGRVGSLLEVGTGFHPELTGRENIYLNGAILGMRRSKIQREFDEIVAFADVEKFIDTPVKHYSSGMYLRLAFAVAAHLEPDILLVDEVLAVGDAIFQKKCLGKIDKVAKEGRTVLFVSHDMTNVAVLCPSAILLESGRIKMIGTTADVIRAYLTQNVHTGSSTHWNLDQAPGDDLARVTRVAVCGEETKTTHSFSIQEPIRLIVDFTVLVDRCRLNPVFIVKNSAGVTVFSTSNYEDREWGRRVYEPGQYRAKCQVPAHLLNDGRYFVDVLLVQETRVVRAHLESGVEFWVHDDGATRGDYVGQWTGIVRPRCAWTTEIL
jgi:lipopolysaccharide transport system ATP-binding protein